MRKIKVNRMISFAAACFLSVSSYHMSTPLNDAFSAENAVNSTAGDLCEDNRLDGFDLCLMRSKLISDREKY